MTLLKYKRVYIASPYTIGDSEKNVMRQVDAANILMDNGYTPFIPLLNHFWHNTTPRKYDDWLEWCLNWVEVSDCVLRLPGESVGADMECKHAKKLGIPVFYGINDLLATCDK